MLQKEKKSAPFIKAHPVILARKDLTPAEKLALIVICRYWPSPFWGANSTIANFVGVTRRQIVNVINNLKTKGLIKCGYAHRNRDGRNHTVRVIVPLCFDEKCRLTGVTGFTCASEIHYTEAGKNTTQTSEADCTLLERNINKNRKATPLPLPAQKQAKALTENAPPQAKPVVRNFSQILKTSLRKAPALTQQEFEQRRREQINRLKAASAG